MQHYAVLIADDPLAEQDQTTLAELTARPMISLQLRNSGNYYVDLFDNAGLGVDVIHTSTSVEMIRTLVASGFGFTILNSRPATSALGQKGIRILPITDAIPPRHFGIVRLHGVVPPKPVERFFECCDVLRSEGLFESLAVRAP